MKRKRIIIAHSWIEVGINNQTRQLAIALSKEHDVWFLSQARIGAKQIKENEHLTVIEWPDKRPTKFKDLWFCFFLFRHIKPDVVMSHFSSIRVSMLGAWLAGVKNRVAWYHTLSGQLKDDLKGFWQRIIVVQRTKLAYFFANHIVALNEAGKKDAMLFLHKRASRVKVINNGMLLPVDIATQTWQQGEKVFLYLGRFHQSKGGDFIIKCCKAIQNKYPEFRLLLVGYGDEEANWRGIIKNEQVEGIVKMPGKVSGYNELFKFLVGAYALLVPSRIDNFPTVIIEAKACAVPSVASKVGGIPEMIEDGVNGFLCVSEDREDWTSKICFLMDNPVLRNKMALNARASFEQKFDINAHVRNVNLFLETLR